MFVSLNQQGLAHKRHRSVWTTWELNVETLGDTARLVLSALALFDASPVPEQVVEEMDPEFASDPITYLEVVRGELMDEASLLQEYQSDDGRLSFGMHRMIREFVQQESRKQEELYEISYMRAVMAFHTCVGSELESSGDSILDPPFSCSVAVGVYLHHSSEVLLNLSNGGLAEKGIEKTNEVVQLFFFTTRALIFLGRTVQASPLCNAQYRTLTSVLGGSSEDYRVLLTLESMGEVALKNSSLNEAEEIYARLLNTYQQKYGRNEDHPATAVSFHQLGMVAQLKGLMADAEK